MSMRVLFVAFLSWMGAALSLGPEILHAQAGGGVPTEQEIATEKFYSSLETALAQKFFDYRRRPVIRVAVFDFTDGAGNVVKSGKELADRITRRLYLQPQFDVVSQEKLQRYLRWNGLTALGRLDAPGLLRLKERVNTLDPENGIDALVLGEVQKGVSRNLRVSVSLVNFRFRLGAIELEKNILDFQPLTTEIPLPTEQSLQDAVDVVQPAGSRLLEEGRLLILANTRGNTLQQTEYMNQFGRDHAFPWGKVPYALILGKEEVGSPGPIRVGLGELPLAPLAPGKNPAKTLEYSFLNGKCATNEIYFDEKVPAQPYALAATFLDLKNNETFSRTMEVAVYPGTTTVVVLSFYVPSAKERFRNKQAPRIDQFQFYGKGMEILPSR